MKKYVSVAALVVSGLVANAFAIPTYVNTVGTYAASPSPAGSTVSDHVGTTGLSANGTATGNVTVAQFTTDVATAFAANNGGVWNGETSSAAALPAGAPANAAVFAATGGTYGDGAANAITAYYGTSLANQLSFYVSTGGGAISPNTGGGSTASGAAYIGFGANQTPTITFSQALSEVGFTMTARGAQRTDVLQANLTSGGVITSTAETTNTADGAGTGVDMVFFGFKAPVGDSIASLQIVSTVDGTNTQQFTRFDDLGFVVATPEPASLSLLGLGGLTFLRRRR